MSTERVRKIERLAVRVSAEQDAIIHAAAEARGTSVSDFVLSTVMAEAQDVLADRRLLMLDDAAWTEFQAVLARPVQHKPELVELMGGPSVEKILSNLQ